jgi:DNA invertase Pin-like site-specific DNA recombinase
MNYRHLSWKTRSENDADKLRDGTHRRGEQKGSRLTEADVQTIRRMCSEGTSQYAVARLFGVSRGTVCSVVTRKSWSWLPG